MSEGSLRGRRAVVLLRCSTDEQTVTSIPAQRARTSKFAEQEGIDIVHEIIEDGTSASNRVNVDRIAGTLIALKDTFNYDTALVYDLSRLHRTNPKHAAMVQWTLEEASLLLIDTSSYVADNPFGGLIDQMNSTTSHLHAQTIAKNTTSGRCAAQAAGRLLHCGSPPYGLDRLYMTGDGTPLHKIRLLSNGRQLRLAADSDTVLEEYGDDPVSGQRRKYIKHKSERVALVPGDPGRLQIVRQMFDWRYSSGWGPWRIAAALNQRGTPGPTGGPWTLSTVDKITSNTAYAGFSHAHMFRTGEYFHCGTDGPERARQRSKKERMPCGDPRYEYRHPSKWIRITHPHLAELLPPEIGARVIHKRDQLAARIAGGYQRRAVTTDKHGDSDYFLKGVLRTKLGEQPMTGCRGGRQNEVRYYRATTGTGAPGTPRYAYSSKRVPADDIERVVLNEIRRLLLDLPQLEEAILEVLCEEQEALTRNDAVRSALLTEQQSLRNDVDRYEDDMRHHSTGYLRTKYDTALTRLASVELRLNALASAPRMTADELATATAAVKDVLVTRVGSIETLPKAELRLLVASLVGRLVIDLETRECEMTLRIPPTSHWEQMGVVHTSACGGGDDAHQSVGILAKDLRFVLPKRQRRSRPPAVKPVGSTAGRVGLTPTHPSWPQGGLAA